MKKGTRDDIRLMVALAVAGGAAFYLLRQNFSFPSLPSVGDFVPSTDTVRNTIGDFGSYANAAGVGAVEGIGLAVGIPRTDLSKCAQDKAAGRWWEASFSCPAGEFLSSGASAAYDSVFGSTAVNQATQADVRRVDNALARPAGADVFYTPYGAYGGI
ncbi:hypothetical protein [Variovorax sp. 3P27G3]|uniref:hypothetical protein n=1 Tax=Variovorax sp. 3P27G3 TaxID=2502214 RepID=UPI0010F798F0|nr:hypothetical protein [Variovorax sp. 3P27G3]